MVFSSLFFIYLFLPLNLLCYSYAKKINTKNNIMLVFSLVFYSWGGPKYLFLLLGMTLINWLGGLIAEIYRGKKAAKAGLIFACVGSLGLLGVFKYTGLLLGALHDLTGFPAAIPQIVLPIGISFYTFQLLSYTIDVYRGDVPAERSYKNLLLYASLFHQCIAGPIVRFKDIANEITHRVRTRPEVAQGVTRFAVGLGKKVLLANTCGQLVDSLLPASHAAIEASSGSALWLGVLMFMLQIYLDFSAYSDMAIGMGLMIGFHYKENFDYPYLASSVSEFWRRWHISLGTFFRDYLYIPLGGNRRGLGRTIFNLFVVWSLTGLWHGASWNYLLWGLYFFVFIAMERLFLGKALRKTKVLSHLYLLLVVYFGWILFKFEDMSAIDITLKGMFMLNGNHFTDFETSTILMSNLFFILICLIAVTPLAKWLCHKFSAQCEKVGGIWRGLRNVLEVAYPVAMLVLSTMALVGNSYNPFLYFQF